MGRKHFEASIRIQNSPAAAPEIDYSPKAYTLRAQLVFGMKFVLIAGGIMLFLVLIGLL
ncbi:MAG: hypothetical protein MUD16_02735 [Desulfobacterales bacterium]|jgi:hypothetical protein|nr:hypothetical protein [Desulfobacterales bacterium]